MRGLSTGLLQLCYVDRNGVSTAVKDFNLLSTRVSALQLFKARTLFSGFASGLLAIMNFNHKNLSFGDAT